MRRTAQSLRFFQVWVAFGNMVHVAAVVLYLHALSSCTGVQDMQGEAETGKAVDGAEAYAMLDLEKVHDPDKEWCYSPKSTTVIGVPFMPRPVQVTYDGALYTRDAELCFFYGKDLKPVMIRQKTFLEGWIPIIQDVWSDDGIVFTIEMFGAAVEGIGRANTVQFVKITANNHSGEPHEARFAAGTRFTGNDHRFGAPHRPCEPGTAYKMQTGKVWRNDMLIYTYPETAKTYAVPEKPYRAPFVASDYGITDSTATCLSDSRALLAPGESMEVVFRMPNYPVSSDDEAVMGSLLNADYAHYREETITFWKDLIEQKTFFELPEKRVENSYKAGLVHLMLATRVNPDGSVRQGSGLPYDQLFFNDYVDMRRIYDLSGHPEFVEINVPWLMENLNPDGMFLDPVLTHGKEIMASHGQALVSLANHFIVTRDEEYGRKVYPMVKRAVGWMYRQHRDNPNGLMPASIPFDAEMIKGHYTSHNLWCLLALRDAIRVARGLGEIEDTKNWLEFHDSYEKAVLEAIGSSAGTNGYVPTGLYDFITGPEARAGFREHQTDQDWENNLLIYPTEVLGPDDTRIPATLGAIRRRKYREGIMTYRNGMHLHQYATVNQAHQYLAINDQKHALLDLYHIILHNGSTHEGFENMTEPWEDMDAWPIPPPHAWAAAKTALLIRNMMVREYGGKAGIKQGQRDLYLFSVLSPAWAVPGKRVVIRNAVTEMGLVSAELQFTERGATIQLDTRFHSAPRHIVIPVPYFVALKDVQCNASTIAEQDGVLVFSPDVSRIALQWAVQDQQFQQAFQDILLSYRRENSLQWRGLEDAVIIPGGQGFLLEHEKLYPGEPLSFDLVKRAFSEEYTRRYAQYRKAEKQPLKVEPPSI